MWFTDAVRFGNSDLEWTVDANMGCCLIALALMAMPRGIVFIMWLNGYIGRAYETMIWPLLGFFFMPWTTAAYAICMNTWGGVKDGGVVLIVVAVLLDLGSHGSTHQAQRRRGTPQPE